MPSCAVYFIQALRSFAIPHVKVVQFCAMDLVQVELLFAACHVKVMPFCAVYFVQVVLPSSMYHVKVMQNVHPIPFEICSLQLIISVTFPVLGFITEG